MSFSRRFALPALLTLVLAACGGTQANPEDGEIGDPLQVGTKVVGAGVYRSPRPTFADLQTLKAQGVKYVLNLENDSAAVANERKWAAQLGLVYISEPMSGFWSPNTTQVNRILGVLADPTKRPILVHCLHGEDRTGLIIGLHRVFHEGVSPAKAYAEMLANGFHKALVFLNHYYEERTGFED